MKRIAQVIPYYFPAMTFGGPAKVVYEYSNELSKTNKISILTSDVFTENNRILDKDKLKNTKNFSIKYFNNINNSIAYTQRIFSNFGVVTYILFNSIKHDIFHFHDVFVIPQIISSFILKLKNKPYFFSPHGILDPVRLKKKSFLKALILPFVYIMAKNASKVIATSKKEENDLKELGFHNIITIYNGIAQTKAKNNKKFNYLKNKNLITMLYVGKLHSQKGLFEFITAMKKSNRNDFQLIIAGKDDGDKKRIQKLINKLDLNEKVFFVGYVTEEDKQSLYEISDIFIHNSYSEGFSISILEALNNGLPVLITKGCNFPDVSDFKAGITIDTPNSNKLVTILKEIDLNTLKKFAINSEILIKEKYTIAKMARRISILYEKTNL